MNEGSVRLGPRARGLADRALAEGTLSVSAISFWEIAMLRRGGRIELNQAVDAWRAALLEPPVADSRACRLSPSTSIPGACLATSDPDDFRRFEALGLRLASSIAPQTDPGPDATARLESENG